MRLNRVIPASILLLLFTGSAICAEKTKPADSLLEKAEIARKTGDLPTAIKLYQKAIVAEPNKQEAYVGLGVVLYHDTLNRLRTAVNTANPDKARDDFDLNRRAMETVDAKLVEIYKKLVTKHPHVTSYRYQLALLEHRKDGNLTSAVEQIVASDPKFAPAVAFLGYRAAATGNKDKEREYLRRASELDPDNQNYAYGYLSTYKDGDQREYLRRVDEFVTKYPEGEYTGSALLDAAENATTTEGRIAFLERAANLPGTYWVSDLLELYARTDVRKANDLAQQKLKLAQTSKDKDAQNQVPGLKKFADYYGALAKAEELLKAGKSDEAKATLDKTIHPDANFLPDEYAKSKLMVEVLAAQRKIQDAYKYLLDDRQTIADPDRQALAFDLGAQLNKTEAQVKAEIVVAVLAKDMRPADFEMENLKGDAKVKLSDFRGKYVLMNSWHPT